MSVMAWLLDSDPSIRWQTLRDLADAPDDVVSAERARVATEGWGARLLSLRDEDGQWAGGACFPAHHDWSAKTDGQPWTSTLHTLELLREFGLDPESDQAVDTVTLVRQNCRWEHAGQPFFSGEVEPCINGRTVALGAYFGQDVSAVVNRLLGEQLDDGGWNCWTESGSVRSSFHTTICVLEGLLAFEQSFGTTAPVTDARRRAQEYLLERHLLRRVSTGDLIEPRWTQCAFPTLWHYDVLRGLDYLRGAGVQPEGRVEEAVATLRERRQVDGRWLLDVRHRDTLHEELAGTVGAPNRWITLRALRVLHWYAGQD